MNSPLYPPDPAIVTPPSAGLAVLKAVPARSGIEPAARASARAARSSRRQLEIVYDLSDQLARLDEPDAIQAALLKHVGTMLSADALYLDRSGCCMSVPFASPGRESPAISPEQVRTVLAGQIEEVRASRVAVVPEIRRSCLAGAHVLLGALSREDAEPGVVVVLRRAELPPFEPDDLRAAGQLLNFGGHVLKHALTVRQLRLGSLGLVCALVNAIDAKDGYTAHHSERVGMLARLFGEALGFSGDRLRTLEWAGLLHDVGKIGVPEHIINKRGRLTAKQTSQMRRHSQIGYDMIQPAALFGSVRETVLYHHENYDGTGYPHGLRAEQIPIDARIIRIVDTFDALTSVRPYRPRYELEQALRLLQEGAGTTTDPALTRTFISALREYIASQPEAFRIRFGEPGSGPLAVVPELPVNC